MADTNFAETKEFESDEDTEETLALQQESLVRDAGVITNAEVNFACKTTTFAF